MEQARVKIVPETNIPNGRAASPAGDASVGRGRIREIVRLLGLPTRSLQALTGLGRGTAHRYAHGEVTDLEDRTVRKLVDSLGLTEWQVRGAVPLPAGWPGCDPDLSARVEAARAPRGRPPRKKGDEPEAVPLTLGDLGTVVATVREVVQEAALEATREAVRRELGALRELEAVRAEMAALRALMERVLRERKVGRRP